MDWENLVEILDFQLLANLAWNLSDLMDWILFELPIVEKILTIREFILFSNFCTFKSLRYSSPDENGSGGVTRSGQL